MAKNKDDLSIKSSLGVQDQICLGYKGRERNKNGPARKDGAISEQISLRF